MNKTDIKQWLDTADSMVNEIQNVNKEDIKLQKLARQFQIAVHKLEEHLEAERFYFIPFSLTYGKQTFGTVKQRKVDFPYGEGIELKELDQYVIKVPKEKHTGGYSSTEASTLEEYIKIAKKGR